MSIERLHSEMSDLANDIESGKITEAQAIEQVRQICFSAPKASDREILAIFQKYDPNFSPNLTSAERRARAELSKKAQDVSIEVNLDALKPIPSVPGMEGQKHMRHHNILFNRNGDEQAAQENAELGRILYGGDKAAIGTFYYNYFKDKVQDLELLLDMNDEDLVNNFARHAKDLDLVAELQAIFHEAEFTAEQKETLMPLYQHMDEYSTLKGRVSLVANPLYSKFPCEQLNVSSEDAIMVANELKNLGEEKGEVVSSAKQGETKISGPTEDIGSVLFGLQSFTRTVLHAQFNQLAENSGSTIKNVTWTNASGRARVWDDSMEALKTQRLVFMDVPGKGVQAVFNPSPSPLFPKARAASAEDVHRHMEQTSDRAFTRAESSNPFYLSWFTGSSQFNKLETRLKEVSEALKELKYPLDAEAALSVSKSIQELKAASDAYLQHKISQGREVDGHGLPIGTSDNERNRIVSAVMANELADSLQFQIQYQLDPKVASLSIQTSKKLLDARLKKDQEQADAYRKQQATQIAKEQAESGAKKPAYAENELCKTSQADLKKQSDVYSTMSACKDSDAGNALERLRQDLPSSVGALSRYAGTNYDMEGAFHQQNVKNHIAKLVLFNYVLAERVALNGTDAAEIKAGTAEKHISDQSFVTRFSTSPELSAAIGKITPARIEQFLLGNEARSPKFQALIQNALAPKSTEPIQKGDEGMQKSGEPIQKGEPEPPKPEPPKPVVPGGPG